MKQSQPLRVENSLFASFGTSRTVRSRLWFVNNVRLENRILGYLAKYSKRDRVPLYAMVFSGSHYHLLAKFPHCNRARFYRCLNARAAEAVRSIVTCFPGGRVFERRYSEQAIPTDEDIYERFFYCALQPVRAGLCRKLADYPGYNSFDDAIHGRTRNFKVISWSKYHQAKRYEPNVSPDDFATVHELKFERLPGFENLSQKDYAARMLAELEKRTKAIVAKFEARGHRFMSKAALSKVTPDAAAKNPKRSTRSSYRPLVLTQFSHARKFFFDWYFGIYNSYKKAVLRYLQGDFTVEFPPGTYRPPLPLPV